eukprot:jgi/Mesen1/5157/ME000256S04342
MTPYMRPKVTEAQRGTTTVLQLLGNQQLPRHQEKLNAKKVGVSLFARHNATWCLFIHVLKEAEEAW